MVFEDNHLEPLIEDQQYQDQIDLIEAEEAWGRTGEHYPQTPSEQAWGAHGLLRNFMIFETLE